MALFVEFHLIQNFAPSNLNRDDTGAPKDALFGGHRRARVSSQCLKKSARDWFNASTLLSSSNLGTRTRHLDRLVLEQLNQAGLPNTDVFNEIVKLSLKAKKSNGNDDKKEKDPEDEKVLSYLLYLSAPEVDAFKSLIQENRELLITLSGKKKIKPNDIPDSLKDAVKSCLKRSKAVDIALFGRMLADLPEVNQDAACQVAHAISTHRVEREFDYFTAVDDKGDADETGAGMIGQVEFNSATFYRYAVIDVAKLVGNLQDDTELALAGLEAFTKAMAMAIPSGKQNTFAAHNLPAFVGVALRETSPINLANAFERPVWPDQKRPLSTLSVKAMAEYDDKVSAFYGNGQDTWAYLDLSGAWPAAKGGAKSNLEALATWVQEQVAARIGG